MCIKEVYRVLKKGGLVFASFIPYLSGSIAIIDRYFRHPEQVDIKNLNEVFNTDEISLIYLNFSDPWPKNAHAKRRLTSERFLPIYHNILNSNGEIHFKTDNRLLFEYSLESLNNNGLLMKNIALDLHNSNYEDNIMTEYEERFSKFGPIYRLEAKFK